MGIVIKIRNDKTDEIIQIENLPSFPTLGLIPIKGTNKTLILETEKPKEET